MSLKRLSVVEFRGIGVSIGLKLARVNSTIRANLWNLSIFNKPRRKVSRSFINSLSEALLCQTVFTMPVVNPEKLIGLQNNAEEVRNVGAVIALLNYGTDLALDLYTGTRRKS